MYRNASPHPYSDRTIAWTAPLIPFGYQTGSGSGVGFDNDSVVPYASVFNLFYDYAQTALDRQQVPITLKDFVRDYFSRLEPTE